MKKTVLTIGVLCCMMLGIDAQTTVESIRKEYNSIKSCLEVMTEDEMIPDDLCKLHVAQNLPGTGQHFEDILFYWGDNEDEDEEHDVIYPSHYLRYVQTKYNYAAREFYEEYMYDAQGNTLFIYARTPDFDFGNGLAYDFRFYFSKGKLINVIIKSGPIEGNTFKDVYTGKSLPKQYKEEYERCLDASKRYKNLYKAIENATML